jgi:multisubunit Na+/H+ antiporter MnhB subunit
MLRLGPALTVLLEPKPYQLHSLRAFWAMLLGHSTPAMASYLLSGAVALGLAVRLWRPAVPLELRYSALLLTTVLVAPHVGIYDLVVLAPAFLLTASVSERSVESDRRRLRALLYFAYAAALTGPLAAVTRVQLTVPVFAAWLLALHQARAEHRFVPGNRQEC